MKYAHSHKRKLNAVSKQIKLYDEFLQVTSLSFDQRMKIIHEMTRLDRIKKRIQSLPIIVMDKDCGDYEILINSTLNENRIKTKFRYPFGSKSSCKQSL